MTTLEIKPLSVPLRADERGVIRVGQSRIVLDIVVDEFENGASPEAIAENYDTLQLAEIYGAITYYLQNKEQVKDYLLRRREKAETRRRTIEAGQPDRAALRAKLLARRDQMERDHAPSAQ
jgi:uncharacterized protein (DUF433 family)